MIHSLAGVSQERFMLRDYYLAIACEMCGVTPQDIVINKKSSHLVATARRAVIYMLSNDGGLSAATVGAMMGISAHRASDSIYATQQQLLFPKQYPLLHNLLKAFKNED